MNKNFRSLIIGLFLGGLCISSYAMEEFRRQLIAEWGPCNEEALGALRNGEVNMEGLNLTGADFSGIPLNRVNFSGATLAAVICAENQEINEIICEGTVLIGVQFNGGTIIGGIFRNSDLSHARFIGVTFIGTIFDQCALEGTTFEGSELHAVEIARPSLARGLSFHDARLLNVYLFGINFENASFNGAYLEGDPNVEFIRECSFQDCDFINARLISVNLNCPVFIYSHIELPEEVEERGWGEKVGKVVWTVAFGVAGLIVNAVRGSKQDQELRKEIACESLRQIATARGTIFLSSQGISQSAQGYLEEKRAIFTNRLARDWREWTRTAFLVGDVAVRLIGD